MPELEMIPVDSSLISAAGYDGDKEELHVQFNSGDRYVYESVPPSVFEDLMEALSPGGYFARQIKPIYPCRKLREE